MPQLISFAGFIPVRIVAERVTNRAGTIRICTDMGITGVYDFFHETATVTRQRLKWAGSVRIGCSAYGGIVVFVDGDIALRVSDLLNAILPFVTGA